jgi:hypothetical protein
VSASRTARTRLAAAPRVASIVTELDDWRTRAVPDADAPLDADDVARLVRDCFASLAIDAAVAESFSVNTVHYYRRKDILDEPDGRTSAARYAVRHVWQAAGARLAGQLGLVSLAEARDALRGADEQTLIEFVAARVADARGRDAARRAPNAHAAAARPLRAAPPVYQPGPAQVTATIVPLGNNAMCIIPAAHDALRNPADARALVDALAAALGIAP